MARTAAGHGRIVVGQPQTVAMTAIAKLPGCSCERMALTGNTTLSGRVIGWGPSLHRTGMAWGATPAHLDDAGVLAAFEPAMAVQRRRAAVAAELGLAGSGRHLQPASESIGHLVADRILIGMFGARVLFDAVGMPTLRLLARSVPARDTRVEVGDFTFVDAGALEGDACGDLRPRVLRKVSAGEVRYDGHTLSFPHALPDTVLVAAVGRAVGDVVDLSRLGRAMLPLADREVVAARHDVVVDRTELVTLADWTSFAPSCARG